MIRSTPLFQPMNVPIIGGYDIPLPRMMKVRQKFKTPKLESIPRSIHEEMNKEKIRLTIRPGDHIAVAVGSRGIANIKQIVELVVQELKSWGAEPFIVPAMGSHGGATPEGQIGVLREYGITEEAIGVPIRASMDVVQVDTLPSGIPVYIDKHAYEADGIVPIARVKPHTDFKGEHESGLMKMLAIGLGKHKGATTLHAQGFDRFDELIPLTGKSVLQRSKVKFGLAIVENAYDETAELVAVASSEFPDAERELLKRAKSNMPKLLVDSIDVLVVEEIGKDISGAGMDPNITGRTGSGLPGFEAPPIQKIVVLDLTEKTHGNACGIGFADVTTLQLVNKMDFEVTYANCITSTVLIPAKIPLIMNTDRKAITLALKCCNRIDIQHARIIRIKNTLELEDIYVSEAYLPELQAQNDIEILSEPCEFSFDQEEVLMR